MSLVNILNIPDAGELAILVSYLIQAGLLASPALIWRRQALHIATVALVITGLIRLAKVEQFAVNEAARTRAVVNIDTQIQEGK